MKSNNRKQVGIFSGSFNPIHVGHLILANYIKEFTCIDEVWLVVTPHNPLKEVGDLLKDEVRLSMAKVAVEQYPDIKVSDIEFEMPKPSYTINTLDKLSLENPNCEFTLIIGGDNWNDFHRWKDYQKLLQNYKVIIYPRANEDIHIEEQYSESVELVSAPLVEISSTFIRKSIKDNRDMRAFVPSGVYDFIINNKLYQ